jgi:hypothetical protein
MRLGIIALTATALLCSIGSASAQSNTATGTGVGGTLCSDLLAMDTTSQGAFLQGYQAAMQDQLVSAGSGINAMGMSSSSSLLGGGAASAPVIGAGTTGTFNTASIITNCTSSPTIPLSQVLSGAGAGTASSSP